MKPPYLVILALQSQEISSDYQCLGCDGRVAFFQLYNLFSLLFSRSGKLHLFRCKKNQRRLIPDNALKVKPPRCGFRNANHPASPLIVCNAAVHVFTVSSHRGIDSRHCRWLSNSCNSNFFRKPWLVFQASSSRSKDRVTSVQWSRPQHLSRSYYVVQTLSSRDSDWLNNHNILINI